MPSSWKSELKTVDGHINTVNSVAFSLDGKWVVFASDKDGTVWIWDAATGAVLHKLEGHCEPVLFRLTLGPQNVSFKVVG